MAAQGNEQGFLEVFQKFPGALQDRWNQAGIQFENELKLAAQMAGVEIPRNLSGNGRPMAGMV